MSGYIRFFVIVALVAFAAIVVLTVAGHVLAARATDQTPESLKPVPPYVAGAFFLLFLVLGFSLVPLMLRAFIVMQTHIGNAELWIVQVLRDHERGVTYGVWGMFALGTLIALPVMMKDLLGKDLLALLAGSRVSQGALVLDVGMPLAEVRKGSTLRLAEEIRGGSDGIGMLIADVVFDFQIAGSALRFEGCRYYWIHTDRKDDSRVSEVSVGVSPQKMSRADLMEAHKQVQQRLRQDGWQPGAIHYRTPEEQRLHGGATSSGQGYYWARGGTVLQLQGKRVDEERRGEDAATAGDWIQVIELRPRSYSGYSRVEFN